ncbi:MAG TPA: outer membrane beta-barrel protein [Bacteroidales bacterium]|nr:outer membrane beta-barrel protein [Bacteroidales bacterium]HSA42804.1 outer membrane beta-barrel protein [Bacteroidales bacterium]
MKNKYLTTISIILITIFLFTQAGAQKFYTGLTSGYNLALGGQNLYYFDFTNNTSRNNAITYDAVFVSLGQGMNIGLNCGYHFNDHIACELDVSWLKGDKQKVEHKYQQGITTCFLASQMIQVMPTLVLSAGMHKIQPFMKLGVLIGTGRIDYEKNTDDNEHSQIKVFRMNGGIAVGAGAAAGVKINISEKLSLSGEVALKNLNYAPVHGEYIQAEIDGIDVLPEMTVYEKETDYLSHYSVDENVPVDTSKPDEKLKQRLPFGSIGIKVGIVYNF